MHGLSQWHHQIKNRFKKDRNAQSEPTGDKSNRCIFLSKEIADSQNDSFRSTTPHQALTHNRRHGDHNSNFQAGSPKPRAHTLGNITG